MQRPVDDPAVFISRLEVFDELQYREGDIFLNQTVVRAIVRIGKKFTTRLDLPYVSNSLVTPANYEEHGLGDISFRVLGYKFLESRKSAVTTSIEISLNTAASPILGTGKNMILPVISYTKAMPKNRMLGAVVLQQTNSFSGDENRKTINFTKVQLILLKYWHKQWWSVVAPSTYFDYVDGGVTMNLEARTMYAPKPRISFWVQGGVGLFGDFVARYDWAAQAGCRYLFMREKGIKH